jgi:hypothetical protein
MIALEPLADGTVADRNFQKLMSLVLDTGGVTAGVRFGVDSMAWTASRDSGPKTITHGLGRTPLVVFVTNGDTDGSYAGIAAYTAIPGATTFDVYGRTDGSITETKTIFWIAIG